jgi:hypothetical protein
VRGGAEDPGTTRMVGFVVVDILGVGDGVEGWAAGYLLLEVESCHFKRFICTTGIGLQIQQARDSNLPLPVYAYYSTIFPPIIQGVDTSARILHENWTHERLQMKRFLAPDLLNLNRDVVPTSLHLVYRTLTLPSHLISSMQVQQFLHVLPSGRSKTIDCSVQYLITWQDAYFSVHSLSR